MSQKPRSTEENAEKENESNGTKRKVLERLKINYINWSIY